MIRSQFKIQNLYLLRKEFSYPTQIPIISTVKSYKGGKNKKTLEIDVEVIPRFELGSPEYFALSEQQQLPTIKIRSDNHYTI